MSYRKFALFCLTFVFISCAELQDVVNTIPGNTNTINIAGGLRQALDFGIKKQVSKLTQQDGFYKNQLVKILLPTELQKVDQTLRDIGLSRSCR